MTSANEYAQVIDLGVTWAVGGYEPVYIATPFLPLVVAFYVGHDTWHDRFGGVPPHPVGVLRFRDCVATRLGGPNDEGLPNHRLWDKGLETYRAHLVRNSIWCAEIGLDEVRPGARQRPPALHYLFSFKEQTLELIARGVEVEVHQKPMEDVLRAIVAEVAQ